MIAFGFRRSLGVTPPPPRVASTAGEGIRTVYGFRTLEGPADTPHGGA